MSNPTSRTCHPLNSPTNHCDSGHFGHAVGLDLLQPELAKGLFAHVFEEGLEGDSQDAQDGPVAVEGNHCIDLVGSQGPVGICWYGA